MCLIFIDTHRITVREDAPPELREYILLVANSRLEFGWSFLRDVLCLSLREAPWPAREEYKIRGEVQERAHTCEWFKVYGFIERLHQAFREYDAEKYTNNAPIFVDEINAFFVENGIGWQLDAGKVVTRGDEAFESTVKTAEVTLEEASRRTAKSHLHNAILALSVRPEPNTAGAVAHATSAVECVLNDITGDSLTLGKYLDRHPGLFHPALKDGLDSLYGYASDAGARHGKEGIQPSLEEAEFVLATCAAACNLLTKKHPG